LNNHPKLPILIRLPAFAGLHKQPKRPSLAIMPSYAILPALPILPVVN